MKHFLNLFHFSLFLSLLCPSFAHSYLTINSPYGTNEAAYDVSDDGYVLGNVFVYNINVTPYTYELQPLDLSADAKGLNKKGHYSGTFEDTTGKYAFIYKDGVLTKLDCPFRMSSAPITWGQGINNLDQIVGYYMDADLNLNGFIYNNGTWSSLTYPGAKNTMANRINNLGQVVGTCEIHKEEGGTDFNGFLYSNGTWSSLKISDAVITVPHGINDQGVVVGAYSDANLNWHGFIYKDGNYTNYDIPGAVHTLINSVNNKGQIAGEYYDTFAVTSGGHGFVSTLPTSNLALLKNLGDCSCTGLAAGNPINAGTGNKFQKETDYSSFGNTHLSMRRYYNSLDTTSSVFGKGWNSTYHQVLILKSASEIQAKREDGRTYSYKLSSGVWTADKDVTSKLSAVSGGWKLTLGDDTIENYNSTGRLTSIVTRSGLKVSLSYGSDGRLSKVTGPFGHALTYSYNSAGRVSSLLTPGGQISYTYDANSNLVSATYQDSTKRQYRYEKTTYPNALTGIVDEKGTRYASYSYDAKGRAVSTEHGSGIDKVTVTYNDDQTSDITNARGVVSNVAYTSQFNLIKPTSTTNLGCDCGSKAYTYDANGFLASTTDENGIITTYTRNARGLELSRTEASGTSQAKTITTTWHATFHLPLKITEPNRTTTFSYDVKGNLLTKTVTANSVSRSWSYTYTSVGQVLTETDPRGKKTTYTYNSKGGVATITNPLGHVVKITSYNADGYPLRIVDANGLVTALTYDARNRITSQIRGTETTTYAYDSVGQLTKVTLPNGSFLTFTYDSAHRLTGIADALGNRIAYTLDAMSNRTKEKVFDSNNQLQQTRSYAYDSLNRLSQSIGALNQITAYEYDGNDNLTSVTDPLNHATQNSYDPLNRLIQSINPANKSTNVTYSTDDLPTSVADFRGNKTTYTYNGFRESTAENSPDAGKTTRTFDAAGNILTKTDARGKVATMSYDALNRLTSTTFTGGLSITYQYDQGTYGKGRLTKMSDPSGSTAWTYDIQGRVVKKVQVTGTATLTTTYQYGAVNGKLLSVTYPSGKVVRYAYGDASGLPTAVTVDGAALLNSIEYQPFGSINSWVSANGVTHTRTFNQDGQLTAITSTGSAGEKLTYSYDAAGRILKISGGSKNPQVTIGNSSHTYSSTSNRITVSSGKLSQNYSHDAAGNLISDGSHSFVYDARGRMIQATSGGITTTYKINGLGQRVKKSNASGTTIFCYDENGHLLGEYDATGSTLKETVWLNDLPLAVLQATSNRYYINPDHLGAPRSITNQSGTLVWFWVHDPYGNGQPTTTGQLTYNLRFPGQYYDAETGLHYNYFRDYNLLLGRYIQSDPIGLAGGLNLYAYVKNNPVNWVDPWGMTLDSPAKPPVNDPNWIRYPNPYGEMFFHCQYRCYLENRQCKGDSCVNDPIQEACYDENDKLVDNNHKYCKCKGTPDQYPQSDEWNHTFNDSGGIYENGWDAFWESIGHRSNP